jgi:RimJ/RimL family protein N-acetyltransferase
MQKGINLKEFETLCGPNLKLSPLQQDGISFLAKSLYSPTCWFSKEREISSVEVLENKLRDMLASQEKGERLILVAKHKEQIVAMSTFHTYGIYHGIFWSLEIGFTWIADSWQRTFVNTEMKYLMLQHSFEKVGCRRVQFAVDPENEKSNRAMVRIGAKLEGVFRKYRPFSKNDHGDRHIYTIIDNEWPEKKKHLQKLMARS